MAWSVGQLEGAHRSTIFKECHSIKEKPWLKDMCEAYEEAQTKQICQRGAPASGI
jgi:hypothetical protein